MKVLVKEVYTGAEEQGKIFEFWTKVELKSGIQIEIFNWGEYDLRENTNKYIECLILAYLTDKTCIGELTGKYLGKFIVPEIWQEKFSDKNLIRYNAVKTNDGIFLLDPSDLKDLSFEKGDQVSLKILRFDLLAWYQID